MQRWTLEEQPAGWGDLHPQAAANCQ